MPISNEMSKLLEFLNRDIRDLSLQEYSEESLRILHGQSKYNVTRFLSYVSCFRETGLLDNLIAGYRSIFDPSTNQGEYVDIFIGESKLLFSFGKETCNLLNYNVSDKLIRELGHQVISQIILSKYLFFCKETNKIKDNKKYLFREYVYSLPSKPIFIIYTTDQLKSCKSVADHVWELPIFRCFNDDFAEQIHRFTNQSVELAIEKLSLKVQDINECQYLEILQELYSFLNLQKSPDFSDQSFNDTLMNAQIAVCQELSKELVSPINIDYQSIAYFLVSTLFTIGWKANYYIPSSLLVDDQEAGYSLFFSRRKEKEQEIKFVNLWRTAANMETAIPTFAYAKRKVAQTYTRQENFLELLRNVSRSGDIAWYIDESSIGINHSRMKVTDKQCKAMQNVFQTIPYETGENGTLTDIAQVFHDGCKLVSLTPENQSLSLKAIVAIVSLAMAKVNKKLSINKEENGILHDLSNREWNLFFDLKDQLKDPKGNFIEIKDEECDFDYATHLYDFFSNLTLSDDGKHQMLLLPECIFIEDCISNCNFWGLEFRFNEYPWKKQGGVYLHEGILHHLTNDSTSKHSTSKCLADCIKKADWDFIVDIPNNKFFAVGKCQKTIIRFSSTGLQFLVKQQ